MANPLNRPAVAILLPEGESEHVAIELARGGFDPVTLNDVRDLATLLATRTDVVTAVLDAETDIEVASTAWELLHKSTQRIPSLLIVNTATLDRLDTSGPGHEDDEYLTRPYSAESVRWRVEAMCIRSVAVDDGSGPILQGAIEPGGWGRRGEIVAIFNPKGGVGKTVIATSLAAMLVSKGERVILVDADTVTGHVPISLGMDGVPTVVDAWRDELEGGPAQTFAEIASDHPSGLRVLPLSSSPIQTDLLDPVRVANAITAVRRSVDYVIVDLHPSYSPLNRAIFDKADRILVPVTPDLPCIRAAMKLREVADELGMRERLVLIVNRANTGVPVADIEKTVGIPVYAEVHSAGLVIIKATNEGRTLVENAPRDQITQDFSILADRLLGRKTAPAPKAAFKLFGRQVTARA